MSRLIEADALMERLAKKKAETGKARYIEGYNDALQVFRSMIHGAPTVDAVPVVRCKNCKHFCRTRYTETGFYCGKHSGCYEYVETDPDHFCSYGEKKDPEPSAATHKRQPAPKYRDLSELPVPIPLGYKLQDGRLVEDEAEAKLLQRAVNEIEKLGKISEEVSRALAEAEQVKREAWRKEHPTT